MLEPIRQQVAASTALLLQESGEQLRKLSKLDLNASGLAPRMMHLGREPERASAVLRQAQEVLDRTTTHFQQLGQISASLLSQIQPLATVPSHLTGHMEVREPDSQQTVGELDALADVAVREP